MPCDIGAYGYLELLGFCVYDDRMAASVICGVLALLCWLLCGLRMYCHTCTLQTAQMFRNFRRRSVEGLSQLLLITWLIGDVANLVGVMILSLTATQRISAASFVFMDGILNIQVCSAVHWYHVQYLVYRKPSKSAAPVIAASSINSDIPSQVTIERTVAVGAVMMMMLLMPWSGIVHHVQHSGRMMMTYVRGDVYSIIHSQRLRWTSSDSPLDGSRSRVTQCQDSHKS